MEITDGLGFTREHVFPTLPPNLGKKGLSQQIRHFPKTSFCSAFHSVSVTMI